MTQRTKPSVLFVSRTSSENPFVDPSVRYRCFNMAQELMRRGFRSQVVTQARFELAPGAFSGFERYIFHRPRLSVELADFLVGLETERAIADFDDLIFDVKHAEITPAARLGKRPAARVRYDVARNAEPLQLISRATVSTLPLARHMRQFEHLTASVVHNHLDPAYLGVARMCRGANPYPRRQFAFGYFPGTASHDLDFAVAAPALAHALRERPDARVLVVGPVTLPEPLAPYAARIRRVGVLAFHALPYAMAQCQKVLAPLEQTIFNESKSGLKYFESALVGCDVLATPIADITRFESPLLYLCGTHQEWVDALLTERSMGPAELEEQARALEACVCIEAAVPGWLQAVGLEAT